MRAADIGKDAVAGLDAVAAEIGIQRIGEVNIVNGDFAVSPERGFDGVRLRDVGESVACEPQRRVSHFPDL